MNIFLISSTFSPEQNPNAFRWGAILEYLSAKGHSITVITTKNSFLPFVEKKGNIEIYRTGYKTLFDWFSYWSPGRKRSRYINPGRITVLKPSRFYFLLEHIADITWRKVYWPDGSCIWYSPARRMIQRLLENRTFDILVTVSMPFTSALLGQYVKDRFPNIQWIYDIEDPFCLQLHTPKNNLRRYRRKNFKAEEKVIQKVDRIVVTNSALRNMYIQAFKTKDKIRVIPPVLLEKFHLKIHKKRKDPKVVFTYIGSFYSQIREPKLLLSVFKDYFIQYPDIQRNSILRIIGKIPKALVLQIGQSSFPASNLELIGQVDRDQVASYLEDSHFLVNLGNSTGYQLPSKIVEYLASGLPVINICQIPDDGFRAFAENNRNVFNYGLYFQNQETELERLHKFVMRPSKVISDFHYRNFMPEAIARSYFQAIADV